MDWKPIAVTALWSLVCPACGVSAPSAHSATCAHCGSALMVRHRALSAKLPDSAPRGVWRYRDWLPLAPGDTAVTLQEGATPLVRLDRWPVRAGLKNVSAKLEYVAPTGSFKDRGASVLVSRALADGAQRITEDSSGNAGASIAAYAARAGLACAVFTPASVPESKLAQIRAYGAELHAVSGPRESVADAAREAGCQPGAYYAGHNENPYFVEGCKTLAFELAEEFADVGLDHVILPVGGGSLYCGLFLGFSQLVETGLLRTVPRLHLVQSSGCMPLVAAFLAGADAPLPVQRRPTRAGGIEIERPVRGQAILQGLRASGGSAVAVDDEAILAAQTELAQLEGIFMEPTSAAAFAGLAQLAAHRAIGAGDTVVVAVTGSGLKDAQAGRADAAGA